MKTDQMIFVFGSNTKGIHGAGAARFARQYRGAQMGAGLGPTGQAYAIPTKDGNFQTLPLDEIAEYVKGFIAFARNTPQNDFQVSCIGCGLAGYRNSQIAPLFRIDRADAELTNLFFDELWRPYLCVNARFWGTL